jgi:hypothetical protein
MNQAFERMEGIDYHLNVHYKLFAERYQRTGLIVLKYPMSSRHPNIGFKYTEDGNKQ